MGAAQRTEQRDFYTVLGAEPSASAEELRSAFRSAVLRHHPDRSDAGAHATRRTSLLNRAWTELRDPVRRLHYDRALEHGTADVVDWPLDAGEAPSAAPPRRRGRRVEPLERSPWHEPNWRSVAGFRVPAEVWMAGPSAQRRWIVEHHLDGHDWRARRERYWLRFAADHYRERGRVDDWLGALERLVDEETTFSGVTRAGLREAYLESGRELRGAETFRRIGDRWPAGSPQRRWAERELRALLAAFRDRRVRRGPVPDRAENAELLLNYLEALGLAPQFADVRAAVVAHRRAGNLARAAELVERVVAQPVDGPNDLFSRVQLLTEAGDLERASALLAEIARGDHPDALDPGRIRGAPSRRLAAARRRLSRARLARARRDAAASTREAAARPPGDQAKSRC
ncbi:MAG TPA: J domain-containing protein [Candidatus Limnocylindria bacterium]|nr:J domain-containing protein [Candidatus Limnocylindria bacterium]